MTSPRKDSNFYYAGGKRIALTPDEDLVAVDLAWCAANQVDAATLETVRRAGKPVGHGILLLQREQLTPAMLESLTKPGCTQPVFQRDGTIMIALPEIRVEGDSTDALSEVADFARDQSQPIEGDPSAGRMSIVPLSNDGRESLTLANEIVKNFQPVSVSPRFLRITPGPVIPRPKE